MTETLAKSISDWGSDHGVVFMLVFARTASLLFAMPSVTGAVPARMRTLLAALITLLLVPSVHQSISLDPTWEHWPSLFIAVAREAFVGIFIGTMIQLIIIGIQLGAEVTSSSGAMQLGSSPDVATGESIPSLAKFVGLLVVAVMFAVGGHRFVLNALHLSFTQLPPGDFSISDSTVQMLTDQLTTGMSAGIRIAAPIVAALLLTNIVIGLISRTVPQLNVLAVGLSINALALLIVTAITIGSAGLIFQEELVNTANQLSRLW